MKFIKDIIGEKRERNRQHFVDQFQTDALETQENGTKIRSTPAEDEKPSPFNLDRSFLLEPTTEQEPVSLEIAKERNDKEKQVDLSILKSEFQTPTEPTEDTKKAVLDPDPSTAEKNDDIAAFLARTKELDHLNQVESSSNSAPSEVRTTAAGPKRLDHNAGLTSPEDAIEATQDVDAIAGLLEDADTDPEPPYRAFKRRSNMREHSTVAADPARHSLEVPSPDASPESLALKTDVDRDQVETRHSERSAHESRSAPIPERVPQDPSITTELPEPTAIDVPSPSIGRNASRAGRVKTRLLGFNPAQAEEMSPLSKNKVATEQGYNQFPVGWLAIVEGPGRGATFALYSGITVIGRGEGQTLRLDFGDNSISRDNHAAVAFDPEQNSFFVGHGGKANLVRLNNQPVLSTEKLTAGDRIRIGETTLRFVPLCDAEFQWDLPTTGDRVHAAQR